MKKLFTILAVAATLVSCAKEDVVREAEGEAIQFGNAFVDNATRVDKATDPSYSANDIESFQLYGTINNVLVYDDVTVRKGDNDYNEVWDCPVNQYWVAGAPHKFIAVVDGNVTDKDTYGMPTMLSYTADGETDILCDDFSKTGNTDGTLNGIVAFTFNHLLSKAMFTVTNSSTQDDNNYIQVVRDIKITNAYKSADYDVAAATWINPVAGLSQSFDNITIVKDDNSEVCANERLLIPGLESVTVSFAIDLYYDLDNDSVAGDNEKVTTYDYTGEKAKTVDVAIEANKAYNFTIAVSVGELITFTVTEQPEWGNGNTRDSDDDDTVNDYVPLQ